MAAGSEGLRLLLALLPSFKRSQPPFVDLRNAYECADVFTIRCCCLDQRPH